MGLRVWVVAVLLAVVCSSGSGSSSASASAAGTASASASVCNERVVIDTDTALNSSAMAALAACPILPSLTIDLQPSDSWLQCVSLGSGPCAPTQINIELGSLAYVAGPLTVNVGAGIDMGPLSLDKLTGVNGPVSISAADVSSHLRSFSAPLLFTINGALVIGAPGRFDSDDAVTLPDVHNGFIDNIQLATQCSGALFVQDGIFLGGLQTESPPPMPPPGGGGGGGGSGGGGGGGPPMRRRRRDSPLPPPPKLSGGGPPLPMGGGPGGPAAPEGPGGPGQPLGGGPRLLPGDSTGLPPIGGPGAPSDGGQALPVAATPPPTMPQSSPATTVSTRQLRADTTPASGGGATIRQGLGILVIPSIYQTGNGRLPGLSITGNMTIGSLRLNNLADAVVCNSSSIYRLGEMAMYGGVSIRRNGGFLGPVQLLRVASLLSQDGQRALEVTLTNTALLSNIIIQGSPKRMALGNLISINVAGTADLEYVLMSNIQSLPTNISIVGSTVLQVDGQVIDHQSGESHRFCTGSGVYNSTLGRCICFNGETTPDCKPSVAPYNVSGRVAGVDVTGIYRPLYLMDVTALDLPTLARVEDLPVAFRRDDGRIQMTMIEVSLSGGGLVQPRSLAPTGAALAYAWLLHEMVDLTHVGRPLLRSALTTLPTLPPSQLGWYTFAGSPSFNTASDAEAQVAYDPSLLADSVSLSVSSATGTTTPGATTKSNNGGQTGNKGSSGANDNDSSTGAILGGVLGTIAVLAVLAIMVSQKKRRHGQQAFRSLQGLDDAGDSVRAAKSAKVAESSADRLHQLYLSSGGWQPQLHLLDANGFHEIHYYVAQGDAAGLERLLTAQLLVSLSQQGSDQMVAAGSQPFPPSQWHAGQSPAADSRSHVFGGSHDDDAVFSGSEHGDIALMEFARSQPSGPGAHPQLPWLGTHGAPAAGTLTLAPSTTLAAVAAAAMGTVPTAHGSPSWHDAVHVAVSPGSHSSHGPASPESYGVPVARHSGTTAATAGAKNSPPLGRAQVSPSVVSTAGSSHGARVPSGKLEGSTGSADLWPTGSGGAPSSMTMAAPSCALVDVQDKLGNTALMWAARLGHMDCLELLLAVDAEPNFCNYQGQTALHLACLAGLTERSLAVETVYNMCQLLLHVGGLVNVVDSQGLTPLQCAARLGDETLVDLLLQHGADVNAQDAEGASAMMIAVRYSQLAALKRLLKTKVGAVNLQDQRGWTALHWAVSIGEPGCLGLLLADRSLELRACDSNGDTALHLAARRGQADVFKLFLDLRPPQQVLHIATLKNLDELNPEEVARECGHETCARVFHEGVVTAQAQWAATHGSDSGVGASFRSLTSAAGSPTAQHAALSAGDSSSSTDSRFSVGLGGQETSTSLDVFTPALSLPTPRALAAGTGPVFDFNSLPAPSTSAPTPFLLDSSVESALATTAPSGSLEPAAMDWLTTVDLDEVMGEMLAGSADGIIADQRRGSNSSFKGLFTLQNGAEQGPLAQPVGHLPLVKSNERRAQGIVGPTTAMSTQKHQSGQKQTPAASSSKKSRFTGRQEYMKQYREQQKLLRAELTHTVEGLELESDNLALTLQALEADAALLRQIVGAKAHVSVSVT